MIRARFVPFATARVWCTITSIVTPSVVSAPMITLPSESPTSRGVHPSLIHQPGHRRVIGRQYGDLLPTALLFTEVGDSNGFGFGSHRGRKVLS